MSVQLRDENLKKFQNKQPTYEEKYPRMSQNEEEMKRFEEVDKTHTSRLVQKL